ncbi:antibiotic biosynthesis monooxygenase [Enterobacter bugandensis]|nr:antibiotic biosynthesis monooxygenase [Enterobacter bugandensis]
MKKPLMLLICMLISTSVFATKPDAPDKVVMNIFELGVRPDRDKEFEDVARQTISASVDHEAGTLAMYALQRSDNPRKAFMVELYENESAYRKHLNAEPYKAFAARAPDIIDRKNKITLEPQFLGDKHIIPNERTINNLVIVEVKPEFQTEFKNIVLPEMAESLKVEKGVLAMYAATDSQSPNRWYFYEIYASEVDYQLHRQTPHFLDYLRQTAHMSARKYAIPVKPVFLRNKGGIKQDPHR